MEYRIRAYVDELFQSAPRTQRAYELKIELTQNLLDKYFALLSEGKSQDDAYNLTVMSIGDVQELFEGLSDDAPVPPPIPMQTPATPNRHALVVTIAVMLYILSVVPLIGLSALFPYNDLAPIFGVVLMFVFIAVATGLLVYNHLTKKSQPYVAPGTVVQDFKEWQSGKSQKQQLMKSIRSAFWPLVLAFYFLISFGTGKWYITWVVFLIAPAIDSIISATLSLQDRNGK